MARFLTGKRALIVGGSGGIGAAVTVALARAGAHVFVHGGHDRDRLERTLAAARAEGATVETCLLELTAAEDYRHLLDRCGPVDILVVSFGPYLEAPLHATDESAWRRMIDLNLTLPALLVSALLPQMRDRGYGRIVLFGGPRADRIEGFARIAAYAAAKTGLASLCRSVARQYAADNVRCNMISPGYVATEYYSPERLETLSRARPSGRLVTPDEIAYHVLHLLRPESDGVNGAIVPVDFGE